MRFRDVHARLGFAGHPLASRSRWDVLGGRRRDAVAADQVLQRLPKREGRVCGHSQQAFQFHQAAFDHSRLKSAVRFEPLLFDPEHVSVERRRRALVRPVTATSVTLTAGRRQQLLGHRQRPDGCRQPRRTSCERPRPASAPDSSWPAVRHRSRDRPLRRGRSCGTNPAAIGARRVSGCRSAGLLLLEERQRRIGSEGRLRSRSPRATSTCARDARSPGSCSSARAIASSSVSPSAGSMYVDAEAGCRLRRPGRARRRSAEDDAR